MLEVAAAMDAVLAEIRPLGSTDVPLEDACGRVVARDVVSSVSLPPWDNSSMDGYAVRSADLSAGIKLRVVETIRAGQAASRALRAGEAMKIMTGAPVPEGADTVIRIEDTAGSADEVEIRDVRDTRRNIRRGGEDIARGATVLRAGTRVRAAHVGVLASIGVAKLSVNEKPRVAIVSSGDELVPVESFDAVLGGRGIVSSNSYSLAALVREAGGIAIDTGISRDDAAALREALDSVTGCDLIITSGGISVGEFDYTRRVLAEMGADVRFWKVRMRPGANLAFGMVAGVPWLGLPGNPVSALVCGELFVRPVLRRMTGCPRVFPRPFSVIAAEDLGGSPGMTHLLRGVVTRAPNGELHAVLTGPQGSGILSSMAAANVLLIVPPGRSIERGEIVQAIQLDPEADLSDRFQLGA